MPEGSGAQSPLGTRIDLAAHSERRRLAGQQRHQHPIDGRVGAQTVGMDRHVVKERTLRVAERCGNPDD